MTPEEKHHLLLLAAKIKNYGDLEQVVREIKLEGWTRASIEYVIGQVYWE